MQLVVVAFVVYLATWTGWLAHAHEYEKHLSATQYTHFDGGQNWSTRGADDAEDLGEVKQSLSSLWHYHHDLYVFHTEFLNDSDHTYQSQPSGWLLLNRPVGVDADVDIQPGTQGCDAAPGSDCLRQVLLLGTPVLWWAGILALLYAVVMLGRRPRLAVRAGVVGTGSTWLPWLQYDDRPIFLFYAVATLPFVCSRSPWPWAS